MKKPLVIFACLLWMALGIGCSKSGVYVIDTDAGTCRALNGHPRTFIPRPMTVAADDRSFWMIARIGREKMQLSRMDVGGSVAEARDIPVVTGRYGASDTALSQDGAKLAYTGVRPSRIEKGQVVQYDSLLYVVGLQGQILHFINGQIVPGCSGGDLCWADNTTLLVIPAASDPGVMAERIDVASGRAAALFSVEHRSHAFPSAQFSKIAIIAQTHDRSWAIRILSLEDGRPLVEIPIDRKEMRASSIVWADETTLYYSYSHAIYRLAVGAGMPVRIVAFDGTEVAFLHAVDRHGNVHFTLRTAGNPDGSGEGWFILDPAKGTWRRFADLHYIRDVLVTRDRRFLVVGTGL